MNKLNMHTKNRVDENIRRIGVLFPNALTERKNQKGETEYAIDFEVLRQELSDVVVEGQEERYQFTWPDKKKAMLMANAPVAATLRPVREDSVNFEKTENLYIEGDNLDVLKLMQETYLGKIKMIYIDPPYNTGNDFVYEDDFTETTDAYLANSGQYDEQGNRMVTNNETNGRFHTDWLNMIYPRLVLARNLLRDDGVIFISIDDGEAAQLRKLCDEIFGDSHFVADLCVVNNLKGRNDKRYIARANERLLMYMKSQNFEEHGLALNEKTLAEYNQSDDGGKYRLLELRKRGGPDTRQERPNLYYPFYVNSKTGAVSIEQSEVFSIIAYPVKSNKVEGRWRWGKETASKKLNYLFGKEVGDKYNIYEKDYYESEEGPRRIRPKSVLSGAAYSTDVATKEYRSLMGNIEFSNPKPIALLKDLLEYASYPNNDDIILDFFSGSATTAHAMMQLNAEDGGTRKFIMVQLPEYTDKRSDVYQAGYKNICEIGKERIRRAGTKIKEEIEQANQQLQLDEEPKQVPDMGFRVLKLDSSNMKDVYYTPDDTKQINLQDLAGNIKEDRTLEDLLFQVMLDLGVPLSSSIEESLIAGKTVFSVAGNFLVACFDDNVTEETITAIAKLKPYYAVLRDSGYANDAVAVNFEQLFNAYSPETVRRVL